MKYKIEVIKTNNLVEGDVVLLFTADTTFNIDIENLEATPQNPAVPYEVKSIHTYKAKNTFALELLKVSNKPKAEDWTSLEVELGKDIILLKVEEQPEPEVIEKEPPIKVTPIVAEPIKPPTKKSSNKKTILG